MAQTEISTGTIAAYFEDSSDARKAVDALQKAGFESAHLGIAHRDLHTGKSATSRNMQGREAEDEGPSMWGKIKSWFGGTEVEPYADERTEGDFANREVTTNPGEREGTGYGTSDLQGSFAALDIPEDRARYLSHRFGRGRNGAVVTVKAGARTAEAESILARHNADFGRNAGTNDYSQQSDTYRNERGETEGSEPRNVQLLGEVLRVHKNRVSRGEVRIRKEVVTENQSMQVPVQREELVIERRPVGENTPAQGTIGEQEIRVPLTEEQATLGKSAVVREEVRVGKKPVEEIRDLKSDVRHEELVVEDETQRRKTA